MALTFGRQYVDMVILPRNEHNDITMNIQWKSGEEYTPVTLSTVLSMYKNGKINKYVFDSIITRLREFDTINDKQYDAGHVYYRIRWKDQKKFEWYSDDELNHTEMSNKIMNNDSMWTALNAFPSTTKPSSAPTTKAIKKLSSRLSAPARKVSNMRTPRDSGYAIDEDAVDSEILKPEPGHENDELTLSIQWKKDTQDRENVKISKILDMYANGKITSYEFDTIVGIILEFVMVNEKNIDNGVISYHILWKEEEPRFVWYTEDDLREISYQVINKGYMWHVLNAFPGTSSRLSELGLVHVPTATDLFAGDNP